MRLMCSTHSVKSPREPSRTWERSSSSNWVKSLRRLHALPVLNIGQKEYCIASADNAYFRQKSKKRMMKEQFNALSIPCYVIKRGQSRGAKRGKSQDQWDHFKAREFLRHAKKKGYSSSLERFQKEDLYRNSQTAIGWAEEQCIFLDSLAFEDKSYTATRRERSRYENNGKLSVNGQEPRPCPMDKREDYP